MPPNRRQREVTVFPVHFEDRSGSEFQCLGVAYLLRPFDWKTIDWCGPVGGARPPSRATASRPSG